MSVCVVCGKDIPKRKGPGRPSSVCSKACRAARKPQERRTAVRAAKGAGKPSRASTGQPDPLEAILAKLTELPARPEGDDEALIAWAGKAKAAREAFWDAFEGEIVDGIEIIRRRA